MLGGCRTYPPNTFRAHRVLQQPRRVGVADAMMDTLCGHSAPSEAQDTFVLVVATKTGGGSDLFVSAQKKKKQSSRTFVQLQKYCDYNCDLVWRHIKSDNPQSIALTTIKETVDQYEMVQVKTHNVSPPQMLAAAAT